MLETLQKRIELLLVPDGGGHTVPGNDNGFVRQRQQTRLDRTEKLAAIATGQIGAAYSFAEERVAGNQFLFLRDPNRQTSLRVPGRQHDVEIGITEL